MPSIGVAVPVPEPWGRQLQDFRVGLGDERAATIPTHITLAPPREVTADQLDEVHASLATAASEVAPYRVHLRGTGTFRPVSPVVFVVVADGIAGCEVLAAAVRRGPLDAPLAFPFHPHVTVAHDVTDDLLDRAYAELAGFEATFLVERFHLYLHDDDEGWRPARDYGLSGV